MALDEYLDGQVGLPEMEMAFEAMGLKMDHVEANVIFHKISQNEPIIQFYHLEELLGQYGTSDLFKRSK